MNSNQRPTTITASEFVAGNYAGKIARGECVVTHLFPMELFTVHDVYEGKPHKVTGSNLYIEYMDMDDPAEACNIRDSEQLTVSWLPQPATSEPDASAQKCNRCDGEGHVVAGWDNDVYENIEGVCPDCGGSGNAAAHAEMTAGWQEAEIARLTAEVARLNKIISRLTERAGVIAWAVETVKQWEHFLNTTEPEEAPTMALCDTLNVLISKVKDYERQAAALADSEPDHR